MFKYDDSLTNGFHLNDNQIYLSYIDEGRNNLTVDLKQFYRNRFDNDLNANAIIDNQIVIDAVVPLVIQYIVAISSSIAIYTK